MIADPDTAQKAIVAQRAEIIKAFVAKHGCEPEDAIQEYGRLPNNRATWRVRIMTDAERVAADEARAKNALEALGAKKEGGVVYMILEKLSLWSKIRRRFVLWPKFVYLSERGAYEAQERSPGNIVRVDVRA